MKKKVPQPVEPDAYSIALSGYLNAEVLREFRFHPTRKWRFDYCIPSARIAVEIEGGVWTRGRHVSPAGFMKDMEKYNEAAVLGWSLLRFTPEERFSKAAMDKVKVLYECKQGHQADDAGQPG